MNALNDALNHATVWTIRRYADDAAYANDQPYDTSIIEGNLLTNEGIALLWDLGIAAGGTAWNNANAYLGVGTSTQAAAATDTGLVGTAVYKAMAATYPQRSNQTVTWRAVFGADDANQAWEEFTVANGNSNSGTNLNRKVSSQGTKTSGQTWTLDLAITLS